MASPVPAPTKIRFDAFELDAAIWRVAQVRHSAQATAAALPHPVASS